MEPNIIIEFFEEKKIFLAFCLEDRGDRLHLLTESNREMNLPRKRIIHSSVNPWGKTLSRQQVVEELKKVARQREALKQEINLGDLWELLVGEQEGLTFEELARLWYGDAVTADQSSALNRALYEDRFYFKIKGGYWFPHSPDIVERLQEQYRREQERQEEVRLGAIWLKAAWEGLPLTGLPQPAKLVEILKEMAIFGPDAPRFDLGKEFLEQAKIFKPDTPFRLLVKLGIFGEDENLELYRLEVPVDFSPQAMQAVAVIKGPEEWSDPYVKHRQEITDLTVFTIDGEMTRDFDDALSWQRVEQGWRLGIHISDVSAYIPTGDPLDSSAQERGTSIYLPERRIPMLPEELSENTFSLVVDQTRLTLSFFVILSEDGEILESSIFPSMIHLDQRLTYREADRLTREEDHFARLHRLCLRLRERRLADGGVHLQLPELSVVIDDQAEVNVSLEDNETPAHQIVSEAMVLANSLGARLLKENNIPAIYRSQGPPREELAEGEHKSLFQLWQNRRRLSRVILDLSPQPHWGLGVPVYTTLSSPIRRYLDLLMHRQLHAALNGNHPPYNREDLELILMALEPALRRANLLKSRRQRYWLLKYLQKRLGQKFPALVLDRFPNRYRLLLTDLLLDTEIPAPPSLTLKPGEMVTVRVDRANPQEDLLKVSL